MALTGDSLWLEVAEGLVTDGSRLDEDMINFITVLYCIVYQRDTCFNFSLSRIGRDQ